VGRFAWLTPDLAAFSAPADCRTIAIPGDLWMFVTGALLPLTRPSNWEEDGDATPEQAAAYFEEILNSHLNSMCAYIGEIRAFSFTTLPAGWLPLDGELVLAAEYPALAAVVPASWIVGEDIALPDTTHRGLFGHGAGWDVGDVAGEETHTLTAAEMPAHTHDYEVAVVAADALGELPAPALNSLAPTVTGSAGSGDPHNNMPPYLVVVWGIYHGVL